MAEIPVEKKSSGKGWLWLLLVLLVVLAIAWWLLAEANEPENNDPVAVEETEPTTTGAMTLSAVLTDPSAYYGREGFDDTVTVAGPLTDRGFWIESGGNRMFAIVIDEPREQPIDINVGATLDISDGTIRNPDDIENLPGDALDEDTIAAMKGEEVVLVVDEDDIAISETA
ncbi:hypothetical protein [Erythrobacter sp. HL-111]|uniref:hypothetical protein n=1 Tax=Erythrobacter sp. HL-111 TaxID=1798193 RepID=UPI0006DA7DC7|nr:hypothetical protein [Erythrobacter sp. HL-111]KPP94978.1 MAG: Protein of unknown function (DUF1180) [Erythrobacteraceae bacterium HL-111]SDS13759.1 hypothetical protein SAMN04515621_1023 [Erythrobacter sp. HL-111]